MGLPLALQDVDNHSHYLSHGRKRAWENEALGHGCDLKALACKKHGKHCKCTAKEKNDSKKGTMENMFEKWKLDNFFYIFQKTENDEIFLAVCHKSRESFS